MSYIKSKFVKSVLVFVMFFGFSLLINPSLSLADTSITGTISVNTVWGSAGNPYILSGTITIASGVTLTIDPGVVVKFQDSNSKIEVNGTLNVNGTSSDKVYFTSIKDDTVGGDTNIDGTSTVPLKGDWDHVQANNGSNVSFSNTVLRYAGSVGYPLLFNNGGTVTISDSQITENLQEAYVQVNGQGNINNSELSYSTYGFFLNSGSLAVSNSNIQNNSVYGGYVLNLATAFTLSNTIFQDNAKTIFIPASVNFIHSGNTALGVGKKAFEISGGVINSNRFLTSSTIPYILSGTITIASGVTLTIDPGVVVKFQDSNSKIEVNGTLNVNGTSSDKVYFTSIKDDTVGGDTNIDGTSTVPLKGDWDHVQANNGSNVSFSNTVLRYAGSVGYPLLFNNGGTVTISDSQITENLQEAYVQVNGQGNINNSELSYSTYGFFLNSGSLAVSNSNIQNNSVYGGYSSSVTVNAINNFWGDATGPYHSTNPTGLGNQVSNNVLFNPWLEQQVGSDTTKPVTVPSIVGTLGANDWYISNASLSLNATDDVSGVASTEYSLDTGISWIPYTTPVTFIDGIHTVLYRSTDTIGNIEDTQTIIIKVDTSLPVSVHNINGTLGLEDWYVSDAELVLNATDTNSDVFEINYSLDGGITWNVYNTPLSFSDGEYTVFYRAVDLAGNTENDHIVDVKVDTVKPVTTPVVGGDEGAGGWRVSSTTLDFTATDDVSSVSNIEYSLDLGSTWNIYSTQLVFGSGTHTVWYRAHDVAGNIEDYQTMVNMVDSNVPVTSVLIEGTLGNEDWYTTSPMVSFTAVSEPSGIASIQYSLDSGTTWNMYSTAFALFDGTHSVFYKSTNNAGTVEPVQTVNIKVDTSLPTSTHTINGVAGANSWYKSDAVIALTSTDSFSGVLKTEYSLDGGATWILYEGEISLTDDGVKSILYRAIDNAGNTGADNTITLKIDTEAPEASILFDEVTKQVTFVGIDENPTTVVTGVNSSLITDEAGHTLLVEFTKLSASSNSNNKTGIQINKLTYDGAANSGIGKRVVIRYLWHTDSSGEFTNLRGRAVDGRSVTISRYRPNQDATRIISKTRKASCSGDCEDNEYFEEDEENCDDKPKTVRTTVSGLVVVGFETNNGNVNIVQNNY